MRQPTSLEGNVTSDVGAVKGIRWLVSLTPWLIFALALATRGLQWTSVLIADRVIFFGNDAYYHMRRIVFALERFPETLQFDTYVNFPEGAKVIWPPLSSTSPSP